jgi:hypothetical protein
VKRLFAKSPTSALRASAALTGALALFSVSNVPESLAQQAGTPAAAQNDANQIQAIDLQIAQTMQDPTIPADLKTQLLNELAAQFNVLVAAWQRDSAAVATTGVGVTQPAGGGAPTPASGTAQAAPPSAATTGAVVVQPADAVSAAPAAAPPSAAAQDVGQLRTQALSVAQQMNAVNADQSLSGDDRTAQLNALAAQFNQILAQLQRSGG